MNTETTTAAATEVEAIFNDETVYDLADDLIVETNENSEAHLVSLSSGKMMLQVMDYDLMEKTRNVKTYIYDSSTEVYAKMDIAYRNVVTTDLFISNYKAMWAAMLHILEESCLIADEVYSV